MMYNYNGVQRKVYNPLFVANEGIKYYSEYERNGDNQSRQYFINTADWLVLSALQWMNEWMNLVNQRKLCYSISNLLLLF